MPRSFQQATGDGDRGGLGDRKGFLSAGVRGVTDETLKPPYYYPPVIRWAEVKADINLSADNTSYCNCYHCDESDGTGLDTDVEFSVFFPRCSGSGDPNARDGDIIAYIDDPVDGKKYAFAGYMDDAVGTVKFIGTPGAYGGVFTGLTATDFDGGYRGWYLCDGGDSTPDLRAKFIGGIDKSGSNIDMDGVGDTGGSNVHGPGDGINNNHEDHGGNTHCAYDSGGINVPTYPATHTATDNRPAYYTLIPIIRLN